MSAEVELEIFFIYIFYYY